MISDGSQSDHKPLANNAENPLTL